MSTRPNVLLITVDQWPGFLLGAAGHPVIETPTIDTLAAAGTRYAATYSECPICIPARRTLMTGLSPRGHGDRVFKTQEPMPDAPTLASTFRANGYQATSVGKLHVYPQRDRIGFDDTIIAEEGRPQLGAVDDYDTFLADRGLAGQQFMHGMSNNEYAWREWHLSEFDHVTNWTARETCRAIKRRDPTRPAFWNMSFTHPHPPLVPLRSYLERYERSAIDAPVNGDWAENFDDLPHALQLVRLYWSELSPRAMIEMRRAFYALCTHIDHQIRVVLGTLREEGLLDNTAILFTADHGDMQGNHGLYAKRLFLEPSACVPTFLVLPKGDMAESRGSVREDLFGLADVMPTLLEIAGITVPDTCEGISMLGSEGRPFFYGECMEDGKATRMIREGGFKLIWYPAGNRVQLFDLANDPKECRNLADDAAHAETRKRLETTLISQLYGVDLDWIEGDQLKGFEAPDLPRLDNRGLSGQRGLHYPTPPFDAKGQVVGTI
ncbi:MAG: sulfatase-like hydrolase/transferase [Rhodospirillales bacterium]|nr:sulfatase-like hydrolase/transferase [Rhodospirillales bacterium]